MRSKKMQVYVTDIFGDNVKIWDDKENPRCEICAIKGRAPRGAKNKYAVEKAILSKRPHQSIAIDNLTAEKLQQPRPPELPKNHAYVCNSCYDVYLTKQRDKKDIPNTLPL
tara:strand:+ start:1564 stop:1896 length:333 start_codon:yes stop_codon:yes gene_type:complete